MSTNTSHYNLVKQDTSEHWSVDVLNSNLEKIDTALWNLPATYKRSLTTSDDLNNLSDGVYYITSNMPLNVPNGDIDIAYSILLQVSTSVIKHQYIIKPFTGVFYMREYSGTPVWQAWKNISNKWTSVSGVTENTETQLPTEYNEVYVEATFSSGQKLCFYVTAGQRQDSGFYYTASANAGGAVSFTGGKKLTIYHPYYGGAQTTYSSIKVWGR